MFLLTEMMMMILETPILTLRHITCFISTSDFISSCPSPFPWLPIFQQIWLICSQPSPRLLVLYSSSLGLCCPTFWLWSLLDYPQPLAHPACTSQHFFSTASRLWKPSCSLCFSSSAVSPSQIPLFVKHKQISPGQSYVPCDKNPEVSSLDLHRISHVIS